MKNLIFIFFIAIQLVGCSPEIGSEKWCTNLKEKTAGEWTSNEAKDYAKHCLFK